MSDYRAGSRAVGAYRAAAARSIPLPTLRLPAYAEPMKKPGAWQPFTYKFIADVHTFTLVNIKGSAFELKQISETGKEVDSFRIAK